MLLSVGDATVVGRHIFYNESGFDGNNAASNVADDGAIATHTSVILQGHGSMELGKDTLLPGDTATFVNYTSYDKGLTA